LSYTSASRPRRREKMLTVQQGISKCSPGFVPGSSSFGCRSRCLGSLSELRHLPRTGAKPSRVAREMPRDFGESLSQPE